MLENLKSVIQYIDDSTKVFLNDILRSSNKFSSLHLPDGFLEVPAIEILKKTGGYLSISRSTKLVAFLLCEPGDELHVRAGVPIIINLDGYDLKFGINFQFRFTVTSIDKDNLRMEGYIDNNYFVTGIFYSDLIYMRNIRTYTSDELSDYIRDRTRLLGEILNNYSYENVLLDSRNPELIQINSSENEYPW